MTSRMNLLTPMVIEPLLRATDRWKCIWDVVNQDSEGGLLPHLGFEKHAAEYWWLVRTQLKVTQTGDQSCRYMQPEPCDSVQDLHDFIHKYKEY
jgi:hypothetical protein